MIPYYVVSALWVATLVAWQIREKQNAKERLETLKLFRAQSLSDYTAAERPRGSQTNFIQSSIQKAYSDMLGDDDD